MTVVMFDFGSQAPERSVIDRAVTYYSTAGSTTTVIPVDNTIPQNTEGAEVTTLSYTANDASNNIRVRVRMHAGLVVVVSPSWSIALFKDSEADAKAAQWVTSVSNYSIVNEIQYEETAGDTSSHTWRLRAGPNNASDTLRWNQIISSGGGLFNGLTAIVIEITEFAP